MPVLYVFLSILALIILLLCIKVILLIEYKDHFLFEVKWLFFRYKVFPAKEKAEKEKISAEEETDKPKNQEAKKKNKPSILKDFYHNQGFAGVMELLQNTASSVNSILIRVYKSFIIKRFNLYMRITGDDSAKTAINYGMICSAVYPAIGTLFATMRVREQKIDIAPDFLGKTSQAWFDVVITVTPIRLINAAIIFLFEFLFRVMIKLFFGSRKPLIEKNKREADKP